MVLSEMLAPYESAWDAWSIHLPLLLKVNLSDEREYSQSVFEPILVAANACMFLLATFEGVVVTYRWIKRGG